MLEINTNSLLLIACTVFLFSIIELFTFVVFKVPYVIFITALLFPTVLLFSF